MLLTTITTIGGLTPILLESSIQAQILIPMATSIAFGELFATLIVLYLVPVSYSLYWSAGGRFGVGEWEDQEPAYQGESLPELTATVYDSPRVWSDRIHAVDHKSYPMNRVTTNKRRRHRNRWQFMITPLRPSQSVDLLHRLRQIDSSFIERRLCSLFGMPDPNIQKDCLLLFCTRMRDHDRLV